MKKEFRAADERRLTQITSLLFYLCSSAFIGGSLLFCHAEIIDRIAVSVGNRVITASDIEREIRVNSFLNGVQPDFSRATKRATADQMVEQKLIQRELETSRYPQPDAAEIEPVLAEFKSSALQGRRESTRAPGGLRHHGAGRAGRVAVAAHAAAVHRGPIPARRPGERSGHPEVLRQDGRAGGAGRASRRTGDASKTTATQIEEKLTGDRADQEMDRWLNEARKRNEIVYHEEAFK